MVDVEYTALTTSRDTGESGSDPDLVPVCGQLVILNLSVISGVFYYID